MQRLRMRAVPAQAALVLGAVVGATGCRTQPHEVAAPAEFAAAVHDLTAFIEREMADKRLPAVSIAVLDGDRTIWARGFGEARPGVAAGSDTVHRVGSISKLLTDIAVMQLVEQGRVDLDAAVVTVLPDFAPRNPFGTRITLRHLMTHHSGLVREPPVGNYFDPSEPGLAATVASLNDTELVYEPGTVFKYSNAGIAVLGRVVEALTGAPFAQAVRRAVIEPLGLRDTDFLPRSDLVAALGQGWMWTYDGREFPAPTFELGMLPAASLYATVTDLVRFGRACFSGLAARPPALLQDATLASMYEPQMGNRRVGLGFFRRELDGHLRVGHGGAMYGFASELAVLPEEGFAVAVVTNVDFANEVPQRIADRALRWLIAKRDGGVPPAMPPAPTAVSAERTAALVGTWSDGGAPWRVEQAFGEPWLVPPAGFRRRLRAAGDELVVDDRLTFGARGRLQGDTLVFGGRQLRRLAERPPAPVAPKWRPLIGEYGWDHNTLFVLERGGVLRILIEWLAEYPLRELGPDRFELAAGGLYAGERVEFERDAGGAVRGVRVGGVLFARRAMHGVDETFRITPVRTEAELRRAAGAAEPPVEEGPFLRPDLVQPTELEPGIQLDIRYATKNNFMGMVFYPRPVAFLQRPAAEALVSAHRALAPHGFGVRVFDAYRPWFVTKMFWDATPASMKDFVADPAKGSRHNRGSAVDVTLYDLASGEPVEMVSGYDEFTARAFPHYPGGTSRQRWHRDLLRRVMEEAGFTVYEHEWWHFDYRDWQRYPILNTQLR